MIEEQYTVNIYFIVVAFDINLGVTSCSLLAGGVLRCPSGLSCSNYFRVRGSAAHMYMQTCTVSNLRN